MTQILELKQETRLKIYKIALSEYRKYNFPILKYFLKRPDYMNKGFCYYFAISDMIEKHFPLEWFKFYDLTELCCQKPKNADTYWFKKGDLTSRIKLLKNAIKQIENERTKQENTGPIISPTSYG